MASPDAGAAPVSILVLNWNGWRDTIECLESVLHLDYPSWNAVVCDNASTDDSIARIREWASGARDVGFEGPEPLRHLVAPQAKRPIGVTELSREQAERGEAAFAHRGLVIVRNSENSGFAAGNNVGLRHIQSVGVARYVWILNNDTVVAPSSLTKLVSTAASTERVGAVGATIYEYFAPTDVQHAAGGGFGPWHSLGTTPKSVGSRASAAGGVEADIDYITGASVLIPLETIARVGLISDEYFMYGEDVDYSLRIRQAGLKLLYAAAAQVWHKGGAAIGHGSPRHDYYAVRNALHLVAKYHPRMTPLSLTYLFYRVVLPKLARGQWSRLAIVARAYRDYASGVFGAAVVEGKSLRS